MPRENPQRQRRSTTVNVTDIATAQRKVFARDIGDPQSASAGLESLGAAFSKFFGGLAHTTQEMAAVEIKQQNIDIERRKIESDKYTEAMDKIAATEAGRMRDADFVPKTRAGEIELEQTRSQVRIADSDAAKRAAETRSELSVKAQAEADALSGRDAPTHMLKNAAYMTAYTMQMGERDGERAAAKWEYEVLPTIGADANIDEEFAKFSTNEFGSGMAGEFGDFYNGKALETLSKRGQHANAQWRANRAKTIYNQGLVELNDSVARLVANGNMTVGNFQDRMQASLALHKDEPQKARPAVIAAMIEGAVTPEALANIDTLLTSKGTGLNGASFAESFPGQWAELQKKSGANYVDGVTLRARAAYARWDDLYREAEISGSDEALLGAHALLMDTRERYGGEAEYQKRSGKLTSRLQKLGESVRDANTLHRATQSGSGAPRELINSTQAAYFKYRGVENILANRETSAQVAVWMRQQGGVAPEFSQQISHAISNSADLEKQVNAFYMVRALQQDSGPMPALSDEAKVIYSLAASEADVSNGDPTLYFQKLAGMTPADRKAALEPVKWQTVYNKPDQKASEAARMAERDLTAGIADELGLDPDLMTMDAGVRDTLLENMGRAVTRARAQGVSDPVKAGVTFATRDSGAKFIPIPAGNGRTRLATNTLPARDSAGQSIVAPGISTNPLTGAPENTLQTFREDAARLAALLPDVEALASDDVALTLEQGRADGVFSLYSAGEPILFVPGQKLKSVARGQFAADAVIPRDTTLARQMLDAWLPAGFRAMVVRRPQGDVLQVGYRFRYQDQTTLEMRARGWTPPLPPGQKSILDEYPAFTQ